MKKVNLDKLRDEVGTRFAVGCSCIGFGCSVIRSSKPSQGFMLPAWLVFTERRDVVDFCCALSFMQFQLGVVHLCTHYT